MRAKDGHRLGRAFKNTEDVDEIRCYTSNFAQAAARSNARHSTQNFPIRRKGDAIC
jgi:hypothetical protein